MLYTHKELLKTHKSNYQIEKAVREQKVFKIEKGQLFIMCIQVMWNVVSCYILNKPKKLKNKWKLEI